VNPPPDPCPGDAWYARVASISYDWRNQMVRYEADDSRCALRVHTYQYDALGRRIGKVVNDDPIANGGDTAAPTVTIRYVCGGLGGGGGQILERETTFDDPPPGTGSHTA